MVAAAFGLTNSASASAMTSTLSPSFAGSVSIRPRTQALRPSTAVVSQRMTTYWSARAGGAVVDLKAGRDADAVGQRGEAATGRGLVEQRGEQAAVHEAWVAAHVGADMQDLRVPPAVGIGEAEWRHRQPAGASERAGRQVARAHGRGDLEVGGATR